MQRRGGSGQPMKGQRALRPKAHKAPTAHVTIANLQEQLDRRTRELDETLQQQTATSEVLSIIRRSPADAQPVFDAIVQSAARLCGAIFSAVFLWDGDRLRIAATKNLTPEATVQFHELERIRRPDRSTIGGRAILDRAIVHVPDVLADPEYSRELALAGGWRAVLGVPLLYDENPVGSLTVSKTEPVPFSDPQIQLLKTFADQAVIAIENVRLFEAEQARTRELSESLEQQTATSEVLKVISSSPGELEPVFQTMLENATRICAASYGIMFLCEGDFFRTAAIYGDLPTAYKEQWRVGTRFIPAPGIPAARAVRTRQPTQVADMSKTPAYLARDPLVVSAVEVAGIRTVAAVPMLKDNEPIGAIAIYGKEVRPFSDKQIELLTNFAAQAVIAIENTRLLNELRESLQQQTATADVLKIISRSTFDLRTVLQTLVESAARLCDADKSSISRERNGAFYRAENYGFSREFQEYVKDIPIMPDRGSSMGRALLEGRVIHIPDVKADPEYTLIEGQKLGDYRTSLSLPMLREGVPIGVLSLSRSEVRPFTDKQIELATTFADQAVIAIENARLLNELRQRTDDLSESLEQQTATSEVLRVISSSPSELEPVFQAMLANAQRICEAKFGFLYRIENGAPRIISKLGIPPGLAEYLQRGPHRPPLNRPSPLTAMSRVVQSRQTVHITDYRVDPSYLDRDPLTVAAVELGGVRTLLVVPMLKNDEPIGAIAIYRLEVRPFTDKQIELVKNFAAQAVIAIENTRLLNELRQRTDDLSEALERQTATAEVLKVISSSPGDLQPIFDAILANATDLCGARFASLRLSEGDQFRTVSVYNAPAALVEHWRSMPLVRPHPESALGRTALTIGPKQT